MIAWTPDSWQAESKFHQPLPPARQALRVQVQGPRLGHWTALVRNTPTSWFNTASGVFSSPGASLSPPGMDIPPLIRATCQSHSGLTPHFPELQLSDTDRLLSHFSVFEAIFPPTHIPGGKAQQTSVRKSMVGRPGVIIGPPDGYPLLNQAPSPPHQPLQGSLGPEVHPGRKPRCRQAPGSPDERQRVGPQAKISSPARLG